MSPADFKRLDIRKEILRVYTYNIYLCSYILNSTIFFMKKTMILSAAIIGIAGLTAFIAAPQNKLASKPTPATQELTKWSIDKPHTSVRFAVSHLVVAETEGTFKVFDGSVEHTKSDWSDAKINFSIDINSINTDNEYRDKHLKSDDFFNAEKYPAMTFKSSSFKPLSGNKYELKGDLTIRDITSRIQGYNHY
jgi:polyisoprenoid-binding protein YceI